MYKIKSYFLFSREHRSGIFLLLLLILLAQLLYYFLPSLMTSDEQPLEDHTTQLVQNEIDRLKLLDQVKKDTIYPFNPNFISDYKGYQLGMTVAEIDRLHRFRSQNKYVNSAKDFQKVTQVSDEFLIKIAPYFKFPDWVIQKASTASNNFSKGQSKDQQIRAPKDINLATRDDLIAVYGIGEKLADKILIEKEKLGGFVSMEQFQFIWGISSEAIVDLQKRFVVSQIPAVRKFAINELSVKELAHFPYFNYAVAKQIVVYRTMHNGIKNVEDLTKIKGMPNEKIKIIALYLEF